MVSGKAAQYGHFSGATLSRISNLYFFDCLYKCFQGFQIVARKKIVNIGHRCGHAHTERLEAVVLQVGVEPDNLFNVSFKNRHLLFQRFHVTLVPAVAQYYQNSVSFSKCSPIDGIELQKTAAYISSTGPEEDILGEQGKSGPDGPAIEKIGYSFHVRAKGKGLNIPDRRLQRIDKFDHKGTVNIHGAADIDKQQQL